MSEHHSSNQSGSHHGAPHNDSGVISQIENFMVENFVKKAPPLPPNAKDILVKVTPWLVIIGLVLSVPLLLAFLGFSAVIPGFAITGMSMGYAFSSLAASIILIPIAILVVTVALQIMALPGLFNRQYRGWKLLFYANLIGVIGTLFSFNLGGLLIDVIVFYLLFQIRERYKQ